MQYMGIEDISALSFHERWDGRDEDSYSGYSLPMSRLRKWLGLGLVKGERFPSNNSHGYTWGVPVSELPLIRQLYENEPDCTGFPKITCNSENFITWRAYMDSKQERHI